MFWPLRKAMPGRLSTVLKYVLNFIMFGSQIFNLFLFTGQSGRVQFGIWNLTGFEFSKNAARNGTIFCGRASRRQHLDNETNETFSTALCEVHSRVRCIISLYLYIYTLFAETYSVPRICWIVMRRWTGRNVSWSRRKKQLTLRNLERVSRPLILQMMID